MSLRSLLMPSISQYFLSQRRLDGQRQRAERKRARAGLPHEVFYFHQLDDPYSALVAQVLPRLLQRYDIALRAQVVAPPTDAAAPDRARLMDYSRKDAECLARHWGLQFRDAGQPPEPRRLDVAARLLLGALAQGRFVEVADAVSLQLWQPAAKAVDQPLPISIQGLAEGNAPGSATDAEVAQHVQAATALRARLGHYLGATFYYAGEWYWGLDRLHYLEQRLQELGAARAGVQGVMFSPPPDWEPTPSQRALANSAAKPVGIGASAQTPATLAHSGVVTPPGAGSAAPPIDFYFSLRSPYSAIAAPRVFRLGSLAGAEVRLRYVLPMVMRGLPVPAQKRRYISLDAAREARRLGVAFGRVNDPLGRPTERGLALMPLAESQGLGQAYVLSFMQGVWAEGVDAGSDRGLRRIAERAGLVWSDALVALRDPAWRSIAEQNRAEMMSLGLWGVPSFRVAGQAFWGQDRLWAVQEILAPSDPLR